MLMLDLEINDLWAGFRVGFWGKWFWALRGVNVSLPKGKIFGLIGPNGAGKTTLIKTLLGFLRPRRGNVVFFGAMGYKEAILSSRLGFVPENPGLYPFITGLSTLLLSGRLSGLERGVARQRAYSFLEKLSLLGHEEKEARNYSKGMQRRLSLAFALMGNPSLLILDEPMSGLDPIGRKIVRELILEQKQKGGTVLFSTHIMPDIEPVCDEIVLIHQGKHLGTFETSRFIMESIVGYDIQVNALDVSLDQRKNGLPEGIIVKKTGDTYEIKVIPKETLSVAINWISQKTGVIQSIEPIRPSLEDLITERFKDVGKP